MKAEKRLNHGIYLKALRRMSPAERLAKAFELSEFSRSLFLHGLRRRFPDLTEESSTWYPGRSSRACRAMAYLEEWAERLDIGRLYERLQEEAEAI
jgi:hypothetical protein